MLVLDEETTRKARGNVHLSGVAFQVLRKTIKEGEMKQLPRCEQLWTDIRTCIEESTKVSMGLE